MVEAREVDKRIVSDDYLGQALDSDISSIPEDARSPLRAKVLAELAASNSKIRSLENAIANYASAGSSTHRSGRQSKEDQSTASTLLSGRVDRGMEDMPRGLSARDDPVRRTSQRPAESPGTRSLRQAGSNSTLASEFSGSIWNTSDRLTSHTSRLRKGMRNSPGKHDREGNNEALAASLRHQSIESGDFGRDQRSVSQRSVTTESLDDDLSLGQAVWPETHHNNDEFQEQMDPQVIDGLRSKARESLLRLRDLKPLAHSEQRTMGEVGPYIASLTRFARLSYQVVSGIDFGELIDVSVIRRQ